MRRAEDRRANNMRRSGDSRANDERVAGNLTQDELDAVVQSAVRDALLDVAGTVTLLVLALVAIGVGVQGLFVDPWTLGLVQGGSFVGIGVLLAAVAFDVVSL